LDNGVDIEKVLELTEVFNLVALGQIDETRVAQVNIKLGRSCSWIALDADWSIRVGNTGAEDAVAVEVWIRDNIESFAAVRVADDAELIVVEEITQRFLVKIKLRTPPGS